MAETLQTGPDEFIPPFPHRWAEPLTAWQRLRLVRHNMLAAFEKAAFDIDFVALKLLNRTLCICNSPETVQYAFSTSNENFERKSPVMRHMLRPLIGDGLFISEGETWQKRRRIVAPIIHGSRLFEFAPVMTEAAGELAGRWAALPDGAQIDMLSQMAHLTAEIICRTIFGRQLGTKSAREVVEGFSAFQHSVSRVDFMSLLGLPDWIPRPRRMSMYRAVRRIHRVLDEIIESYRHRPDPENASMVGHLLEARDSETGEKLDSEAVRNEAVVIFMAGHETTANTLAFAWFLLSQAPQAKARLQAEIDQVLGGRLPTLADVAALPFTRAVVQETLRLYPPIPILAREAIRDETIGKQRVPKGALVLVIPWLLHRNGKLWDRPDHFLPERFLPGGGAPVSKWSYVPFSIGPRVCAGLSFGMTEAILCIAILARDFDVRLADGHTVEPVCRVSLRPGDTLPMTLHRRHAAPGQMAARAAPEQASCPFGHG